MTGPALSAAALVLQPFVLLYLVLLLGSPITTAERATADPLVQLVLHWAGPLAIPACAVAVAGVWWRIRRPTAADLRAALRLAAIALPLAALGLGLARYVLGPTLPAFIPPEESARPGMVLGLGAGVIEEVVFRLVLLPALFTIAQSATSTRSAALAAVVTTGFAFALMHEVGPGAGTFTPAYFLDRVLFPGILMSVLAFWPGAAFVVALHCSAHVILPLLFP